MEVEDDQNQLLIQLRELCSYVYARFRFLELIPLWRFAYDIHQLMFFVSTTHNPNFLSNWPIIFWFLLHGLISTPKLNAFFFINIWKNEKKRKFERRKKRRFFYSFSLSFNQYVLLFPFLLSFFLKIFKKP